MNKEKKSENFALRRSFSPYLSLMIIFSGVTILAIWTSFQQHDWTILEASLGSWFFFAVIVFIGTRYRIYWSDGEIKQQASGPWIFQLKFVSIKTEEITQIKQETSNVGTLAKMNRPFSRISIYAGKPRGGGKFIDVSLKHFAADDIRRLMRAIHEKRPDLTFPKHWI